MYLVVTRSFPPEVGGMQNLMWGLTNSISKIDLTKVFADHHEKCKEFDKNVSFSIERVGGIKILRKYRKAYLVNNFIERNKNIKCVISDHWKSLELIKTNKKKICLIHSKEINHDNGSRLNKRATNVLNNVDYIISNSEFTKNLAINKGVEAENIRVINPGVYPPKEIDKKFLKEADKVLEKKNPRLITVSRYDKRKNHEKVIMALRNLKEIYPSIIYTCIGYGDEEENLKKLVNELDLKKHVNFLSNISQELKNALIQKSDIFVMPSIIHKKSVEGFGIAYVEAAQYGIPSIGGKDGGAADAIKDNESGIICDGNNLDEVYLSIKNLIDNKKFMEFGKKAKELSKNYLWENILIKYKEIL